MTGPQHYTEGERLLTLSEKPPTDGGPRGAVEADVMIAQAHAHFAAAQVAATLDVRSSTYTTPRPDEWAEALK